MDQELVKRFRWKKPWGDMLLTEVTKDNLFDLHKDKVEGPRPWMPPGRNEDDHRGVQ